MTEMHRLLIAILSIGLYVLWVAVLFLKHKKSSTHTVNGKETLIVYASQTGTAEKIARAKAADLSQREPTTVVSMASLTLPTLNEVSKVIFVVSTYGEGEPPDAGRRFSRALQRATLNQSVLLSHLSFEVVGLGDREYSTFCQFAVTLYKGITSLGGRALSPLTTIDSGKGEHLSLLQSFPQGDKHLRTSFVLNKRTQLNASNENADKHSPGLYALSLDVGNQPSSNQAFVDGQWEAGDVFEVVIPPNEKNANEGNRPALISRSYTIASVPQEHDIKLVVRQLVKDNGQLGMGSGLLTQTLALSQSVQGGIRKNASAIITNTQCPLILIAAGSGVAGIRAQLAKRAFLKDAGPVWIFFGERHPKHDDILDKVLSPFQHDSLIYKKSVIFSREEGGGYVQQLLVEHREEIKSFLHDEGQVYVCGHYEGMGQGVDKTLQNILGKSRFLELQNKSRYHRDLY